MNLESTTPTPGAVRAAKALSEKDIIQYSTDVPSAAEIIDRETGVRELLLDSKRLSWLELHLVGRKWADTLPDLKPEDEKYIGSDSSLRQAIDAAIARCEGKAT